MTPKNRNFTQRIAATRQAAGRHQAGKTWNAMRMLGQFTVDQLVAVVETSTARTIGSYASVLTRGGFLRRLPSPGNRVGPAVYQLIRNTGPRAPSIVHRRTALYDHNTDTQSPLRK